MIDPVLKVVHNAGFFSCCTVRLKAILNYYNNYDVLPVCVDSSQLWNSYKDMDGDITYSLFNNIGGECLPSEKEINFLNYDSGNDEQFSDYSKINYKGLKFFIDKYFSLSYAVEETKQFLIKKYKIDVSKTIAVYFRGGDKEVETILPSHDEMLWKLKDVKTKYPDYKIIIQSDEKDFYDSAFFPPHFFYNLIIFDEIYTPDKWNKLQQLKYFLAIVSIISDCHSVIMNSGNVAMWICLLRGNAINVSQYLNIKKEIYGVQQKNYNPEGEKWIETYGEITIKFK